MTVVPLVEYIQVFKRYSVGTTSKGETIAIKLVVILFMHRNQLTINIHSLSTKLKSSDILLAEVFFSLIVVGIPNVFFYGREGDNFVMGLELLGDNLDKLLIKNGKPFSLKTVTMLGIEMVKLNLTIAYTSSICSLKRIYTQRYEA